MEKTMEYENDGATNGNWCTWYSHQRICTMTGELWNKKTICDNPKYSIIEIGQNTEKSAGYMKRLAVTLTPGINHRLTMV